MPSGNPLADQTNYLRRQAEFCLWTSEACSDRAAADDWILLAAEFHTRALRFELDDVVLSNNC